MKVRQISSAVELDELTREIEEAADRTRSTLASIGAGSDGINLLWSMKFQTVGHDPLDPGRHLNLIEQLNQTFTYLTTIRAVRVLFDLHPEYAPFTLNLGTAPGSDIQSTRNGGLAAEVFAATSPKSNRKLDADIVKVGGISAQLKYVFFMSPGFEAGRQQKLERKGVRVWSVGVGL